MPYRLRNASADYRAVNSNPVLAENMRRLMGGRSIETVRAEMAEAGVQIGTGTLHRALKGQTGNRLESLEKIAQFFGVTIDQLLLPQGDDVQPIFSEEAAALAAEIDAIPDPELRAEALDMCRKYVILVKNQEKRAVLETSQLPAKRVAAG
jgi:transcriptional regulator with XRE-family HTH domain